MGKYNRAVITDQGEALRARAIAGEATMQFAHAKTSSYIYPDGTDLTKLTELQEVKQTVIPSNVQISNETLISVRTLFGNEKISEEYLIQNVGIYASDGEKEILFAVCQAIIPDQMPVYDGVAPSSFIYNVQLTVSQATDISLVISGAGTATTEDILDLEKSVEEVDKKKIDASGGDISDTVITSAEEPTAEYPVPAAGDSTKVFLGKTRKFFSDIKNWMTGVCMLGQIVNNCVTDNAKLPLSAAQGKQLMDLYNVLNTNQKKGIIDQDNIGTLKSPSQLTHNGFYAFGYCSADVNSNLDDGAGNFTDYNTGDFHALLIAAQWNSNGCRFGTLIVTSPRFAGKLWIGRIWEFRFAHWHKVAGT